MIKGGRLIIIDTVVYKNATKDIETRLNFNLLVTVGGKERNKGEFYKLLETPGFGEIELIETESIVSIIHASKMSNVK